MLFCNVGWRRLEIKIVVLGFMKTAGVNGWIYEGEKKTVYLPACLHHAEMSVILGLAMLEVLPCLMGMWF